MRYVPFSTLALSFALGVSASAQSPVRQDAGDASAWLPPSVPTERAGALLFEDFESTAAEALPEGWLASNDNADDREWIVATTGGTIPPDRANSGVNYAGVFWNTAEAANDWLFTPAVTVTAGTEYRLRFYFKPGDPGFNTSENFAVLYGDSQDPAAMGEQIYEVQGDPAVSPGRFIEETFTPSTSGDLVIGFYCFSVPDQYFCAIDDVEIVEASMSASEDTPADGVRFLGAARPNPAVGTARVTLQSATTQQVAVEVFDALGRRVLSAFEGTLVGGVETPVLLDMSALPAGAYVVRATGETLVSTQPLTVVR